VYGENVVFESENEEYRLRIVVDECAEDPRNWDNLGTMVCGHRRYDLGDEKAENTELYSSWDEWLENEVIKPNGGWDKVVVLPLYLYDHGGITMNTTGFSCPWDSGQVGWIYCTKEKLREETGYSEDELFNKDRHRIPKVGEHVKVKGFEDKGWGMVEKIDEVVTVNFDYNKIPSARKPENVLIVKLSEIIEVMADMAEQILKEEVKVYDLYLRGEVYGYVIERKVVCECRGHVEFEHVDSCFGFYGRDFKTNGMLDSIPERFHELLEEALAV